MSVEVQTATALPDSLTIEYRKRLMVAAGRASTELGSKIAERLGVGLTDAGLNRHSGADDGVLADLDVGLDGCGVR